MPFPASVILTILAAIFLIALVISMIDVPKGERLKIAPLAAIFSAFVIVNSVGIYFDLSERAEFKSQLAELNAARSSAEGALSVAVEARFDKDCTFNGHLIEESAGTTNAHPCMERGSLRIWTADRPPAKSGRSFDVGMIKDDGSVTTLLTYNDFGVHTRSNGHVPDETSMLRDVKRILGGDGLGESKREAS